jgi:hypothetical protein
LFYCDEDDCDQGYLVLGNGANFTARALLLLYPWCRVYMYWWINCGWNRCGFMHHGSYWWILGFGNSNALRLESVPCEIKKSLLTWFITDRWLKDDASNQISLLIHTQTLEKTQINRMFSE